MARYKDEFRNTILELYKSGKSLAVLRSEYGIPKSTISTWVKDNSPVSKDSKDDLTLKELRNLKKGYGHTCKEVQSIVNLIDELKEKYKVALLCKVLGILRSTYYSFRYKKTSKRAVEREVFKQQIKTIYDDSKGIYGAPKIHNILTQKFDISIKIVQRIMSELGLKSVIVKKFKHHTTKVKIEDKDNILGRHFSTNTINEKWVDDITYIHTIKDGWCYCQDNYRSVK